MLGYINLYPKQIKAIQQLMRWFHPIFHTQVTQTKLFKCVLLRCDFAVAPVIKTEQL